VFAGLGDSIALPEREAKGVAGSATA
jgi:hypothetical protein